MFAGADLDELVVKCLLSVLSLFDGEAVVLLWEEFVAMDDTLTDLIWEEGEDVTARKRKWKCCRPLRAMWKEQ